MTCYKKRIACFIQSLVTLKAHRSPVLDELHVSSHVVLHRKLIHSILESFGDPVDISGVTQVVCTTQIADFLPVQVHLLVSSCFLVCYAKCSTKSKSEVV